MKLRDYQEDAVARAETAWADGARSVLVELPTGMGKAQPLDALVLTPAGFVPMARIAVGQLVIGGSGEPIRVLGVYPQGRKPIVRVTFDDGAIARCCEDHLWAVRTKSQKHEGRPYLAVRTRDLGALRDNSGQRRLFVPLPGPAQLSGSHFGIHPYLMGCLLGDGCFRNGRVVLTCADEHTLSLVRSWLPAGERLEHVDRYDYGIRGGQTKRYLSACGLMGKLAHEKHVPPQYLLLSVTARLDLLRGLMDADGTVSRDGHCEFNTTSYRLAVDVVWLVRSLGGRATMRERAQSAYTYKGERRNGRMSYRITVSMELCPFALPRKAIRHKPIVNQGRTRAIESIVADGEAECQCISVDATDGLYVTDDFVVTHNTILTSELIRRAMERGKVMFLAHRRELIHQASQKIVRMTGLHPAVEMAERRYEGRSWHETDRIVLSSIQTHATTDKRTGTIRAAKFDPKDFALVVIDECHRSASESYRRIVSHYTGGNPACRVLGITATPNRADGKSLACVFDRAAYADHDRLTVLWGIQNGWLAPIVAHQIFIDGLDMAVVKDKGADFDPIQLAAAMEANKPIAKVVETVIRECDGTTLIFAASVDAARMISAELHQRTTHGAAVVTDKTPDEERRKIIAAFRGGELRYLANFGIFAEGFDATGIRHLVIARPTKSELLYRQMLGRATRVLDDVVDVRQDDGEYITIPTPELRRERIAASAKPHADVWDFVGNCGRHQLVSALSALAGELPDEIDVARANLRALKTGVNVAEEIERTLSEAAERKRLAEERRRREVGAWAGVFVAVDFRYTKTQVDPFGTFERHAATIAGSPDSQIPATQPQVAALRKWGVQHPEAYSKRAASVMLDELAQRKRRGLCSPKMGAFLRKKGIDPTGVTAREATQILLACKSNGWRLPPELHHWRHQRTPAPQIAQPVDWDAAARYADYAPSDDDASRDYLWEATT